MNRILFIALILIGLGLGYFGFTKLENSGSSLEIGKLEISAEDKGSSTQAYIMMGLGALLIGAGIVGAAKK